MRRMSTRFGCAIATVLHLRPILVSHTQRSALFGTLDESFPCSISSKTMVNFLTVNEVASLLKLHRNQVYKLISSGKLAGHKIGGAIRVNEGDLMEYIESCRIKTRKKARKSSSPRLQILEV